MSYGALISIKNYNKGMTPKFMIIKTWAVNTGINLKSFKWFGTILIKNEACQK